MLSTFLAFARSTPLTTLDWTTMRIESFSIRNYKGIALASMSGLSNAPSVFLSGRNGTGKTLVLEALASLWSGRTLVADRVGPWGDEAAIDFDISLTDEEFEIVAEWHLREYSYPPTPQPSFSFGVVINRLSDSVREVSNDNVIRILRNVQFQRLNPFATIDFLAAQRQFNSGASQVVDLGMFDRKRLAEERNQMFDQQIEHKNGMWLPDVGSYLVTLDYQRYLAERQGLEISDDFSLVADAFYAATGKRILQPRYDVEKGGSSIEIELPSGPTHGLTALSSGEREMLALMYFVRRLSAAGGILFLDEPEKHLHPSLQAALFDSTRGLADRAQIFVVTHSPNLIATARPDNLLEVLPPVDSETNQIELVSRDADRLELMRSLGIEISDLVQNDLLIVVEGDDDAHALTALFPIEMGRSHIMIAGGSSQVVAACATLEKAPEHIPWIAIRDRDFMTKEAVQDMEEAHPSLFVWGLRELENVLLDSELVMATVQNVKTVTEEEIAQSIGTSILPLIEDVVEALALEDVRGQHPPAKMQGKPGKSNRARQALSFEAESLTKQAASYDEAAERFRNELRAQWSERWPELVDGKVALRAIHASLEVYRNADEFKSALLAKARESTEVRPKEIERLRVRIVDALSRS